MGRAGTLNPAPVSKTEPVAIIGMGLCTPIGINTVMTQAEVACGTDQFMETEVLNGMGEPVRASILTLLDRGFSRTERMALMAKAAAEEALAVAATIGVATLPVFLGLPEQGNCASYLPEQIQHALLQTVKTDITLQFLQQWFFPTGRASFFQALQAGVQILSQGRASCAMVGSADSLCDPESLCWLAERNRLLGANIDGILPGEGAGFVLLTIPGRSPSRQTQGCIKILGTALAREPHHFGHSEPNLAEGLNQAFACLRGLPLAGAKRVDRMLSCQTGEAFWNKELLSAYLRNAALMPEPLDMELVAESHGDAGAASGIIQLSAALHQLSHISQDGSGRVLVYGCSDNGLVGASVVQGAYPSNQMPVWFLPEVIKDHPARVAYHQEFFEHHLEEIGYLLISRQEDFLQSRVPWPEIALTESRISLHLDAMVIAGSDARKFSYENLENSDEEMTLAAVYTIASLASEKLEVGRLMQKFAEVDTTQLDLWTYALKLAPTLQLECGLEKILTDLSVEHKIAIADVMSYRCQGDASFLTGMFAAGASMPRTAHNIAATALAQMKIKDAVQPIAKALFSNPGSYELVLALICLGQPRILDYSRISLQKNEEVSPNLPCLIAMAGNEQDGDLLLQTLTRPELTQYGLQAVGIMGLGRFIPVLLEYLETGDSSLQQTSANSLEWITAAGLSETIWVPDFDEDDKDMLEPGEETEGKEVTIISTSREAWEAWWASHQADFQANRRYRRGKPFNLKVCLEEIENPESLFEVRRRAGMELNLRTGFQVFFEPDRFVSDQQQAITRWKQYLSYGYKG